ncbi:MAG: hypothetical protein C4536_01375 [Actinobacteria bacterium]|nr:MAG: hypothetical protein C4536_01375 [Actinomycetota bacterium]
MLLGARLGSGLERARGREPDSSWFFMGVKDGVMHERGLTPDVNDPNRGRKSFPGGYRAKE